MSASLSPSLPNHIWSQIIDQARRKYASKATLERRISARPAVASGAKGGKDVLARCSLVCKRFADLCLPWRFEFVCLESRESFVFFQNLIVQDSRSSSPRGLGSLVKDLRFFPKDPFGQEASDEQVFDLCLLLGEHLPSLQHLGTSKHFSALPSLHSKVSLLPTLPPITSLEALDPSPETMGAFLLTLKTLQPTLRNLAFQIRGGPLPPNGVFHELSFPFLHTLRVFDYSHLPSQMLLDLLSRWSLPELRRVEFTVSGGASLDVSGFLQQHGSRIKHLSWQSLWPNDPLPFLPHLHLLPSLVILACPPFNVEQHPNAVHHLQHLRQYALLLQLATWKRWEEEKVVERLLRVISKEELKDLRSVCWDDYGDGGTDNGAWKTIMRWLGRLRAEGVEVQWK